MAMAPTNENDPFECFIVTSMSQWRLDGLALAGPKKEGRFLSA